MDVALVGEELGVEDGGAGCATAEIVGEQNEADVEDVAFADASYDDGHAVAGVAVEASLRAIVLFADFDGRNGRGRKAEALRLWRKIA